MPGTPADLVFVNGSVLTVDSRFTVASALAVTDGLVSAVGDRDEVMAHAGPATRTVDLGGGTLLPGINDSHLHGCALGLTMPPLSVDVSHPAVRSLADVAEAVWKAAETTPAGEWISGHGWDTGYLAECVADPSRLPSRHDLDAVSPDHPVLLYSATGHATWVNSAALARAVVDRNTPVPPGGVIVTDAAGEPTGLLQEGAQDLVHRALPALSPEVRADAIRATLRTLARLGITSYTEPGLGPGGDALMRGAMAHSTLDVYRRLLADGELTARVGVLLLPTGMTGTAEEFVRTLAAMDEPPSTDPRRLAVLGVKLFADGIPVNKTAWMHEPYVGGGCGSLCIGGETDDERVAQITEMIRYTHAAGYQAGVHVTGDRAIDTVVDAFAAASASHPRSDARHYVIHGDFLTARSMRTLAQHGFGVNMNPTIKWTVADLEEEFVGPQRAAYEWPYRDAIDAGVTVTSGSDAPVTLPDWRQGVATMMLRESRASGRVSGPDQRIRLAEALRTYTSDAAWQDFAEDWKGTLEVGKVADLCVLAGDLLTADPHDIPAMPVVFTAVGGDVVHDELTV
ncbi:amidohydrolase [Streptomyces griseocarneus]|uniref:amidohydrolase n=1 Tax=Streptomyces griseocarneus TaxID=51201 RepID=UPI00167CBD7E|nr:amidohydrolase [Streptomyces griseocarneus]MBZ6475076.1 amidohydrolase [Streptomyces griseocarneus]GHG62389.1 amidohydrolase [Streptomyces griseocarneus]